MSVQASGLSSTMFKSLFERITLSLAAIVAVGAAVHSSESALLARREFGFSLNNSPQGQHYTLFIYTVFDGKVVDSRPLRVGSFVLQAAGLQESEANLESIDLFETYGIHGCGPWSSDGQVHAGLECAIIGDLWKLRARGALRSGDEPGWAGEELRPSDRQQVLLQAYREPDATFWQGPYVGKDAFRLLRDMQDPDWVRLYRTGG